MQLRLCNDDCGVQHFSVAVSFNSADKDFLVAFFTVVELESVRERVRDTVAVTLGHGFWMWLHFCFREAERERFTITFYDCRANDSSSNAVVVCLAIVFNVSDCLQLRFCNDDSGREHFSVAVSIDSADKDTLVTFLIVVELESVRKCVRDTIAVTLSHGFWMWLQFCFWEAELERFTLTFYDCRTDDVSSDAIGNSVPLFFVVCDCMQLRLCNDDNGVEHFSIAVSIDIADEDALFLFITVVELESVRERVRDTVAVALKHSFRLQFRLGFRETEHEHLAVAIDDCCSNYVSSNSIVNCVAVLVVVWDGMRLRVHFSVWGIQYFFVAIDNGEFVRKRLSDTIAITVDHGQRVQLSLAV